MCFSCLSNMRDDGKNAITTITTAINIIIAIDYNGTIDNTSSNDNNDASDDADDNITDTDDLIV